MGDSPRDWDNLGKIVAFHKRYNLGDKTDIRSDMFNGWAAMEKHLIKVKKACVILPIYMYDHSGITINTTGFGAIDSDRWDWGQIGFIYCTAEDIRKNWSVKSINKKLKESAEKVLLGEIETYDQYLRGDVYGYVVTSTEKCNLGHEHENNEESVWGFYGTEDAITDAKAAVDSLTERKPA